jgi:hypothetical protein
MLLCKKFYSTNILKTKKIMKKMTKENSIFIKSCLDKFNEASNKIEAVFYLKEILLLLKKDEDPKTANFLDLIQKELNFEIGATNWKRAVISCPEIGFSDVLTRCLIREEELKTLNVYAPNNKPMNTWDYINAKIVSISKKYKFIYFRTVLIAA